MKTIYDYNETMKIIGRQMLSEYVCKDGIASTDFDEVLSAERANCRPLFGIALDFFALGFIYGKRAERARKKNREG